MGKVRLDAYVVAGLTDHITPWKSVYQTARILGDETTFVLSNAGHLQSLLNPPGNPKATFVTGPASSPESGGFRSRARRSNRGAGGPIGANGCRPARATRSRRRGLWETPSFRRAKPRLEPMCLMRDGEHAQRERFHERNETIRSGGRAMNARMVRVLGQDLWVSVKPGAKDRPPLLLFNGIGANVELAEPFMREMGDVETVVFDIPGVGGSPLPRLPYRPSTVARWAAGLMHQLGYDRIDVAGVSWGGGVAQQFAHQYPKVCRRLILAATAPGVIMVPGKLSVLWKMASPRRYIDPDYLHSIAAEIYGGNLREDPSLIHAHAENMKGPSNLGYLYQLLALAGWTSLFWLRSLTQPTLVVMGQRRSDRADGEWPDPGSAHSELPAGSDGVRPSVHRHDAAGNREALPAVSSARREMYLSAPNISPPSSVSASLERSPSDQERSRDLARIKIIATTLLAFSVVVAFVARLMESRYASLGYVAAWAEAAAVGGLADWYAVVALFRHPCGVPLPHTAIISNNRERIAESFGDFVEEQFLAPDPIEQKLRSVDFAAAVADWLADEERSLSLSRFALRLLPQALSAVEETGLQSFMAQHVVEQIEALEVAPLAAKLIVGLRRGPAPPAHFRRNSRRTRSASARRADAGGGSRENTRRIAIAIQSVPRRRLCVAATGHLDFKFHPRSAERPRPCACVTTSTGSSWILSKSWARRRNTPTRRRR